MYSALLGGEVVRVERVKGLDITCGAATTRYFVCDDDGRYEAVVPSLLLVICRDDLTKRIFSSKQENNLTTSSQGCITAVSCFFEAFELL